MLVRGFLVCVMTCALGTAVADAQRRAPVKVRQAARALTNGQVPRDQLPRRYANRANGAMAAAENRRAGGIAFRVLETHWDSEAVGRQGNPLENVPQAARTPALQERLNDYHRRQEAAASPSVLHRRRAISDARRAVASNPGRYSTKALRQLGDRSRLRRRRGATVAGWSALWWFAPGVWAGALEAHHGHQLAHERQRIMATMVESGQTPPELPVVEATPEFSDALQRQDHRNAEILRGRLMWSRMVRDGRIRRAVLHRIGREQERQSTEFLAELDRDPSNTELGHYDTVFLGLDTDTAITAAATNEAAPHTRQLILGTQPRFADNFDRGRARPPADLGFGPVSAGELGRQADPGEFAAIIAHTSGARLALGTEATQVERLADRTYQISFRDPAGGVRQVRAYNVVLGSTHPNVGLETTALVDAADPARPSSAPRLFATRVSGNADSGQLAQAARDVLATSSFLHGTGLGPTSVRSVAPRLGVGIGRQPTSAVIARSNSASSEVPINEPVGRRFLVRTIAAEVLDRFHFPNGERLKIEFKRDAGDAGQTRMSATLELGNRSLPLSTAAHDQLAQAFSDEPDLMVMVQDALNANGDRVRLHANLRPSERAHGRGRRAIQVGSIRAWDLPGISDPSGPPPPGRTVILGVGEGD